MPHRTERVSEALREELSELIAYELEDPRIGDTIVTEVLVSPDMRHAQVRLHMSVKAQEQQDTIAALEGARHFLRRRLTERISIFRIPELHFESDVSSGVNNRVGQLMKRIRRGRPRDQNEPAP